MHFADLETLIESDVAARRYSAQRAPQRSPAMSFGALS
jgi:hypothetical protein